MENSRPDRRMSRAEESQCDLLAILLQFDPYKRPTAHQALSRFAESIRSSIQGHAYLDDLHDEDAPRVTFWVSELRTSHWPKAMWTGALMRRCRPRAFSALGVPRKSREGSLTTTILNNPTTRIKLTTTRTGNAHDRRNEPHGRRFQLHKELF